MPCVVELDSDEGMRRWYNVNCKTGYLGVTSGMDVKFIQFLFYASDTPKGDTFKLSQINGKWTGWTASVLKMFEEGTGASPDGCVDPVRPGHMFTTHGKRLYKILSLQMYYLASLGGFSSLESFLASSPTKVDMEDALARMPDDNPEMPTDLKYSLKHAWNDGTPEF